MPASSPLSFSQAVSETRTEKQDSLLIVPDPILYSELCKVEKEFWNEYHSRGHHPLSFGSLLCARYFPQHTFPAIKEFKRMSYAQAFDFAVRYLTYFPV